MKKKKKRERKMHLTSIRNWERTKQSDENKIKARRRMYIRCLMCNKLNNCLPFERVHVCECGNVNTKEILSVLLFKKKKKKTVCRRKCTSIRLSRVLLPSCDCMEAMHGVPVLLMLSRNFEHVNDSSLWLWLSMCADIDVYVNEIHYEGRLYCYMCSWTSE